MNNSEFIIFLDIDGVICSYDENIYMPDFKDKYDIDDEHFFKQEAIDALNTIIDYYKADLCMVSSWNGKFKDEEHYKEFLTRRGIHVNELFIGKHYKRCGWIIEQIKELELKHYLVIDDECNAYYKNMDDIQYLRILKTDRNRCLDKYDAKFVTINLKL